MSGLPMSGEAHFFETPPQWRSWLEANHDRAREVWVGYRRKATGLPTMTWSESVDEALCFGWIDGVRRTIDDKSYKMRFTPRKPKSEWSKVNLDKADRLIAEGLMAPAGMAAWERRIESNYSYERDTAELEPEFVRRLEADKGSWDFFMSQPPGYRRTVTHWISSAKRPETRLRRFEMLLKASRARTRVGGEATPWPAPPRK